MIVFTFYASLIIRSMVTAYICIHKLSFLHFHISSEPQSKCLTCRNFVGHLGLQKSKPPKDKCPELHGSGQGLHENPGFLILTLELLSYCIIYLLEIFLSPKFTSAPAMCDQFSPKALWMPVVLPCEATWMRSSWSHTRLSVSVSIVYTCIYVHVHVHVGVCVYVHVPVPVYVYIVSSLRLSHSENSY